MLLLNRSELKQVLKMTDTVEAIEAAFRDHQEGKSLTPMRMHVELERVEGVYLLMPSYMDQPALFGTKLLSVYPRNQERNIPTISSVYVLCDADNGAFISMMDGAYLTGMRTAAASAVAARYLARQDASIHGILGTGVQAIFQAEAMSAVRPIERLIVFDLNSEAAGQFARNAEKQLNIPVTVAQSTQEVAAQADIFTTITTAATPVIRHAELKPGCHVNAVGAFKPTMREVGEDILNESMVVVDTYEGCLKEAGDLMIPLSQGTYQRDAIHAELGELVLHQKSGRENDEHFTLFKSVGIAFEDLVTANLAYTQAKAAGLGNRVSLTD